MCGIFGWATPRPLDGGDRLMSAALGRLAHRGPDSEGAAVFRTRSGGEAALGHRRLSIIDLDGGAQPMTSRDGRFAITFNGEIYNYLELRAELEVIGARFHTRSDTEVILEAWSAWGEACLGKLRGMFAFAIYDLQNERVVLARDPFGKKPLFLARVSGGWAFASEIAPLLDLPGVSRRLNPDALGPLLIDRYVTAPGTAFADICKLAPGSLAYVNGPELDEWRYHTPPFARISPEPLTLAEAAARLRPALDEAVRLRMRCDAAFGVFLSGGLDSSVVAALMARHSPRPISSFAIGFEDGAYSELAEAEGVATSLGADHHALVVTPRDFADHWESATAARGAPVSEASDIPILMLARAARSSVKMVLTGEGADELLAGYPKHRAEQVIGAFQGAISPGLLRVIASALGKAPVGRRLGILSRALCAESPAERERLWFASASPEEAAPLTGHAVPPRHPPSATVGLSAMRASQLADQTAWLPDNLLERADRMMMAGSIEGRMPFMDAELAEVVARFPEHVLASPLQGKRVLRLAARDLVDRRVLTRRKVGFRTPIGSWMRDGVLRDRVRDLLQSDASRLRRLLDPARIDGFVDAHLQGRRNQEKLLWTLANLELFLRVYRIETDML